MLINQEGNELMGVFEWHLTRHLIPWKEQSQYHIFYSVYSSMHGRCRRTVLVRGIYSHTCCYFNSVTLFCVIAFTLGIYCMKYKVAASRFLTCEITVNQILVISASCCENWPFFFLLHRVKMWPLVCLIKPVDWEVPFVDLATVLL